MYRLRPPAPALAPYIERYWSVHASEAQPLDLTVDVFVDARADLVFNLGAPYTRTVVGGDAIVVRESNLDAQRTRPIKIAQRGAIVITGVRFHTAGVSPFVSVPVSTWTDGVVPIAEAFGAEVHAIEAALRAGGPDLETQAAILDAWFTCRVELTPQKQLVQAVKRRIEDARGLVQIQELCRAASVSIRHLDRLFDAHVGVGPKTFARIVRFQHGLAILTRAPTRPRNSPTVGA